jgi:hypothetical protein
VVSRARRPPGAIRESAILTLSLRRPASWHVAFVLVAAAVPCLVAACAGPTYGPGSGTLVGIVTRCTLAEDRASGCIPDPARFLTVSAQNQAGRTISLSAPAAEHVGSPLPNETAGGDVFDQRRLRVGR